MINKQILITSSHVLNKVTTFQIQTGNDSKYSNDIYMFILLFTQAIFTQIKCFFFHSSRLIFHLEFFTVLSLVNKQLLKNKWARVMSLKNSHNFCKE